MSRPLSFSGSTLYLGTGALVLRVATPQVEGGPIARKRGAALRGDTGRSTIAPEASDPPRKSTTASTVTSSVRKACTAFALPRSNHAGSRLATGNANGKLFRKPVGAGRSLPRRRFAQVESIRSGGIYWRVTLKPLPVVGEF